MNNRDVFKHLPLDQFKGQWVVVAGGRMIGHAKDPKDILEQARKEFPEDTPCILLVPSGERLHYHTWQ